ncbi:hypothetical protein HY485_00705, partial [Candidatus Woesearchaeota archaeon]|nr:hypothetical protein [Candidatus Woesearchaeota archaeon]
MQKGVFVILFVLLSLSVFASLTPDNVYLSSALKLQTNISSNFAITSSDNRMDVDYVKATMSFFPRENHRQTVDRMAITPPATVLPNSIEFLWDRPTQQKIEYKIDSM